MLGARRKLLFGPIAENKSNIIIMKTYTPKQLEEAWRADLLSDARCAREQAEVGPYYPDRGITREMLLAMAEENEREAGLSIPKQFAFNSQTNQPWTH